MITDNNSPAAKEVAKAKQQPQLPRMWDWVLFVVCLIAVLWIIRIPSVSSYLTGAPLDPSIRGGFVPGDIIVLVSKATTIAIGGALGMWIDRSAFPYGRPDRLVDPNGDGEWELAEAIVFTGACLRRAFIMIGLMSAFGSTV